jgi:phosphoribosylformimino-5-aminoimidazole carboxamide ribotide isomerase
MLIIPVIDLYLGHVVHAHAGQRDSYKNIVTPLCSGSDPVSVVAALLSLYPFRTMYIADLNAIKDEGNNNLIIDILLRQYPDICFWLDSGKNPYKNTNSTSSVRQVIGSETGISHSQMKTRRADSGIILSLDFLNHQFLGEQDILRESLDWPDDIIVMCLSRVGTNLGPDLAQLEQIQTRAGNKRVYAAGGARNETDLKCLYSRNIAGVLVATALHNGKISRQALKQYA